MKQRFATFAANNLQQQQNIPNLRNIQVFFNTFFFLFSIIFLIFILYNQMFYLHISHTYSALNYNLHKKYYFYQAYAVIFNCPQKVKCIFIYCFTNYFKVNDSATMPDKINWQMLTETFNFFSLLESCYITENHNMSKWC